MKWIVLAVAMFFQVQSSFARETSVAGNWQLTDIKCHMENEYQGTPIDFSTDVIRWSFKVDGKYTVAVSAPSMDVQYMERGYYNFQNAQLCMRPYDGFSEDNGYRNYAPVSVCASFALSKDKKGLTILAPIQNPHEQGCPRGDMLEMSFQKVVREEKLY